MKVLSQPCGCQGLTPRLGKVVGQNFTLIAFQRQRRRHCSSRSAHRCLVRAGQTAVGPTVAIVGVSGAVGKEFLRVSVSAVPVPARPTCTAKPTLPLHFTGPDREELSIQGHEDACFCKVN